MAEEIFQGTLYGYELEEGLKSVINREPQKAAEQAKLSAAEAANFALKASESERNAKTYQDNAKNSETTAGASNASAEKFATEANTAKIAAQTAQATAEEARNTANDAAVSAKNSNTQAGQNAAAALQSATAAENAKTGAKTAEQNAITQANIAKSAADDAQAAQTEAENQKDTTILLKNAAEESATRSKNEADRSKEEADRAASYAKQLYIVDTIDERNALNPTDTINVYVKDAAGVEKTINATKWSSFKTALADYWFNNKTPAAFETLGDISVLNDELLLRKNDAGDKFENWADFAENKQPGPESELFIEFINQMSVYAASGVSTDLNWFTLARINVQNFKRTDTGAAFTATQLTQAKNRIKGVITEAKLDPNYWDGTTLNLSWYQVQYALITINGDLLLAQKARLKNYIWAPEWAVLAYPASQINFALTAISFCTNAASYIDSISKTINIDYWPMQYALLNYGKFQTVPTDDEIKSIAKYPWKYVAGGDPTVKKGGAYYLWDKDTSTWIKTAEAESMDVITNWDDVQDKPEAFVPVSHAATHGLDGSDPINPYDLQRPYATYTPESGTRGKDYAVKIPGISNMYDGLKVCIIPHATNENIPLLRINSLSDYPIYRTYSANTDPYNYLKSKILSSDVPIDLIYSESQEGWMLQASSVVDYRDVVLLPVGSYLVGSTDENGLTATSKTPDEVRQHIGAVASVNGIEPDETGNVDISANKTIYQTYTPEGGIEGKDFAIDAPEIAEPYDGLVLRIKFHTANIANPHLRFNGAYDTLLSRYRSNNTMPFPIDAEKIFSINSCALNVQYSKAGTTLYRWVILDIQQPAANDLTGIGVVKNGFTGLSSIPVESYLVGNGIEKMLTKTPTEVRKHIGAAPASQMTALLAKLVALNVITQADADSITSEVTV